MSKLLLDERPIVIQPSLVRRLGIAEAAVVQQLHYWLHRSKNIHEGDVWVYKTYAEWSDEIGLSTKAVRGALGKLRDAGIVVSMPSPTDPRDRTLWWRIDREVLDPEGTPSAPEGSPICPRGQPPSAPEGSSRAGVQLAVQRLPTETTNRDTTTSFDKSNDRRVFDTWIASTNRTGATLYSAKRQRLIQRALSDYSLSDVLDAVRGWRYSPHHRGENHQGVVYNDLELLLRDPEHIEKFRDLERNPSRPRTQNGHNDKPSPAQLLAELNAANPRLQAQTTEAGNLNGHTPRQLTEGV